MSHLRRVVFALAFLVAIALGFGPVATGFRAPTRSGIADDDGVEDAVADEALEALAGTASIAPPLPRAAVAPSRAGPVPFGHARRTTHLAVGRAHPTPLRC